MPATARSTTPTRSPASTAASRSRPPTFASCDICQAKRGFLFCKEDRAILCKGCDANVHGANYLTIKHNRRKRSDFCSSSERVASVPARQRGGSNGSEICEVGTAGDAAPSTVSPCRHRTRRQVSTSVGAKKKFTVPEISTAPIPAKKSMHRFGTCDCMWKKRLNSPRPLVAHRHLSLVADHCHLRPSHVLSLPTAHPPLLARYCHLRCSLPLLTVATTTSAAHCRPLPTATAATSGRHEDS
ncbi:hypothetical protein ZIOFF_065163 [Zingiber officinale]|uniref:B box-type domain-containing protein n=1 Tax=Zingiber officinale TaxID=94328 RepID=A0A8J5EZN7_ZINOF|nr:hypothetical protein ZIOFF_065163 [Zingiber officinale]